MTNNSDFEEWWRGYLSDGGRKHFNIWVNEESALEGWNARGTCLLEKLRKPEMVEEMARALREKLGFDNCDERDQSGRFMWEWEVPEAQAALAIITRIVEGEIK